MADTTKPLRTPIAHSVRYAARGLPEVPNQYGDGILAPSEITLTYRAAPDSQLGRVHAYVAGRLFVDGAEIPLLPGGLYGQYYDDGLDGWPAWLTEEARLHDPDAPVSPAPADLTLPVSEGPEYTPCVCGHIVPDHDINGRWCAGDDCACVLYRPAAAPAGPQPEAQLAPLEAAARAAALTEAADFLRDAHFDEGLTVQEIGTAMRHWADRERADAASAASSRSLEPAGPEFKEDAGTLKSSGPGRVAGETQQPTDADVVEAHELALSFALNHAETQQPLVSTVDKAAALGLTDTEYRARSHEAAVATVRAAIPGMYAHVGFRVEDVLNEAGETQQPETQADDEGLRAKVDDATSTLRRIRTALRALKEQGATGQTYHQVITNALAGPRPDEAPEPETEADIVREHVTTVHLIGEQLADVESWLWKRLAEVRAEQPAAVSQPETEA